MALGATKVEHRTAALIGNPNTGKSTLFVALSGVRQHVANYPGATVEKKVGSMVYAGMRWELIDLPGTYSLAPRSPDEMVTVDVLLGRRSEVDPPDLVICVVDASNLSRNLYLLSQVLELGRPTIVALTMLDVAQDRGIEINIQALESRLGIPVLPVHARKGQGLDELCRALEVALQRPVPERPQIFPAAFQAQVASLQAVLLENNLNLSHPEISGKLPDRFLVERLLLDQGSFLESKLLADQPQGLKERLRAARLHLEKLSCPIPAVETTSRYQWVNHILEGIVTKKPQKRKEITDRLDLVLTHPFWGLIILAFVLLLMFQAVFRWATWPMDQIESLVAAGGDWVKTLIPEGALQSLLVEGIIGGVGAVLVFLPQIVILFLFLAILEDCGYLARAAYLMDRSMVRFGLSGKSFIPLLSSFACAIPGVMAARVIDDRRDRLVTILVAPLMSCSARLPVYALLIAAFIPNKPILGSWIDLQAVTFLFLYAIGIVTAAIAAWLMKKTILQGGSNSFVMELPPYRRPSFRVVLSRMFERAWGFIEGAGTMILAVSIVMWAALYYPRLPTEILKPIRDQEQLLIDRVAQAELTGQDEAKARYENEISVLQRHLAGQQSRNSLLGRFGRLIEPLVRPLGWDWRIGSAAIASFPAREVVVASLGVIFDVGEVSDEAVEKGRLRQALKLATWPDTGKPLFTAPVALSVMVFFALCAQCVSTLAVIRRETNSWRWPLFSFVYMTALAYLGAFLTYQIGSYFS